MPLYMIFSLNIMSVILISTCDVCNKYVYFVQSFTLFVGKIALVANVYYVKIECRL